IVQPPADREAVAEAFVICEFQCDLAKADGAAIARPASASAMVVRRSMRAHLGVTEGVTLTMTPGCARNHPRYGERAYRLHRGVEPVLEVRLQRGGGALREQVPRPRPPLVADHAELPHAERRPVRAVGRPG